LILFALGYRPFFLLAGIVPVVLMPLWLMVWLGLWAPSPYYAPVIWHAHEMLYGYASAVIAGFLLTAVRNWTGLPTPEGPPLAVLAGLWLLARVLPLWPTPISHALIASIDLAFLPAAVGIPLVRHGKWQNMVLLAIPAAMVCGNALVHFATQSSDMALARRGIELGLYAVLLLIVVLGGRVIPFFTRGVLPESQPKQWPSIEITAIVALVATAAALIGDAPASISGSLAMIAAILHAIRLAGWYSAGVWRQPLLWVLFVAYAWLVLGLGLAAAAAFNTLPASLAVHALTAGAINTMTFGMMARVALGHSGRPLRAAPLTVKMFYLLNLAALVRVVGVWLAPQYMVAAVVLSGVLFTLGALCFVSVYGPILLRPRIDGKPG